MATAGSGDVLTGIILSLLAQGYTRRSVILGVYLHGRSGDLAVKKWGPQAMIAGDIIKHLGKDLCSLYNNLAIFGFLKLQS